MKLLITGAKGFIGRNLVAELHNRNYNEIYEYDLATEEALLEEYCRDCDFVFNLAGVNRPNEEREFMEGNFGFACRLLNTLKKYGNKCPIVLASSIQAESDNPYGKSKRAGEDLFFSYGREYGVDIFIYRFPNVFGKWCKPNYNSVVATFCYNIARNLPIQVREPSAVMTLIYIDDLMEELIHAMEGQPSIGQNGFCYVPISHTICLGEIAGLIRSFRDSRENGSIPAMAAGSLVKKLYSTYLSYLPVNLFSYPLKMNVDSRGSFTEIIRTQTCGQFSVNISKPGVVKGNHWHHTKNEKFIVVSGKALIRFREVGRDEIIDYHVSGEKIEVVDIPTGYTHCIINEGSGELITLMWCNECYDPERPDTYRMKIEEDGADE